MAAPAITAPELLDGDGGRSITRQTKSMPCCMSMRTKHNYCSSAHTKKPWPRTQDSIACAGPCMEHCLAQVRRTAPAREHSKEEHVPAHATYVCARSSVDERDPPRETRVVRAGAQMLMHCVVEWLRVHGISCCPVLARERLFSTQLLDSCWTYMMADSSGSSHGSHPSQCSVPRAQASLMGPPSPGRRVGA